MSNLSFMEKLLVGVDVKWKPLGEVATITIGEFVHKNNQDTSAQSPVYNGGTSHTGYYDKYNNTVFGDNYLDRLINTKDKGGFQFIWSQTLAWKTYHSTSKEFIYEQTSTRTKPRSRSSTGCYF